MAKPIPDGFHSVTPHIVVTDGAAAIEFCKDPFGHPWSIATHQHDYTSGQIAANAKAFFAKMAKTGSC